jgi:hypothetical protein
MQKRSAIPFVLALIALIAGGCAQAQIQRYDREIIKRCRTTVVIVDTLDNSITIARPDFGDTVYVVGSVTKLGWTSAKYLARYHNEIGMVTASDGLVDMGIWDYVLREHVSDSVRTATSTGSSAGSGHDIQTGPRGGKYYINSNGNKTYVKKK